MNKKILLGGVLLVLLIGLGYWMINRPKSVDDNNQNNNLVGGQRDEHGCLGPAGYAWDETTGACTRGWELNTDPLRKAAKLAVDFLGRGYGLTVVGVAPQPCVGCFTVSLEQGTERTKQVVNLRNWQENKQATAQTVSGIAQALAKKYNRPVTEVHVTVSDDRGIYVRGSVLFGAGGPGEGGLFLAVQNADGYEIVFDGNGGFRCTLLEQRGFPKDMQEGCS